MNVRIEAKQALRSSRRASNSLSGYIDVLNGSQSLTKALRQLPEANYDGSDIQNLDQLALAMGVHRKSVPFFVIQAKDAALHLQRQAIREISSKIEVKNDAPTGVAVLAMLENDIAQRLAVKGGEKPEAMHVTLGFANKKAAEYNENEKQEFVANISNLIGTWSDGFVADAFAKAHFNPEKTDDDRDDCAVVLVQSNELADVHEALMDVTLGGEDPWSHSFPIYTPHVTVGYNMGIDSIPEGLVGTQFVFDRIIVAWAGEEILVGAREEKRLIRVRTAEGARRFKQPVGAIVQVDKDEVRPIEAARIKMPATRARSNSSSFGKTDHFVVESVTSPDSMHRTHFYYFGDKLIATGTDTRKPNTPMDQTHFGEETLVYEDSLGKTVTKFEHTYDAYRYMKNSAGTHDWKKTIKGVKFSRHERGNVRVSVKDSEGTSHYYDVAYNNQGKLAHVNAYGGVGEDSVGVDTQAGLADFIKMKLSAVEEKIEANPRSRHEGNFGDLYWGIEGKHWSDDDEPGERTLQERISAMEEKESELGVAVIGDMHIDHMEHAFSVMETYNEMYPGFSRVIPVFEGTYAHNMGSNAVADNLPFSTGKGEAFRQDNHNSSDYDLDLSDMGHGFSWIRLNDRYFGRESGNTMGVVGDGASRRQWWSCNLDRLREQKGETFDDSELVSLMVINHEIGHTVAEIATTFVDPNHDGNRNKQRELAALTANEFFNELNEIINRWDIGSVPLGGLPTEESDTVDYPYPVMSLRSPGSLDKAKVREVLSEYGAKNIHELCAESWAEYMMDESPREFATEVGSLMHSFIGGYMELLDEAGY